MTEPPAFVLLIRTLTDTEGDTAMSNEQIIRTLRRDYGIGSGEVNVAIAVREGRLRYEDNRETVDRVESAIAEITEDDER